MTGFRLYNTVTRSVEPFVPADGKTVRMYTCGPAVYSPSHVGNFRTFLFEDLMRRVLRLAGWNVEQVMNFTDVDDKIIGRATRAQHDQQCRSPHGAETSSNSGGIGRHSLRNRKHFRR